MGEYRRRSRRPMADVDGNAHTEEAEGLRARFATGTRSIS
jgi:hypothetical protein